MNFFGWRETLLYETDRRTDGHRTSFSFIPNMVVVVATTECPPIAAVACCNTYTSIYTKKSCAGIYILYQVSILIITVCPSCQIFGNSVWNHKHDVMKKRVLVWQCKFGINFCTTISIFSCCRMIISNSKKSRTFLLLTHMLEFTHSLKLIFDPTHRQ